jgi:hypothetical protein
MVNYAYTGSALKINPNTSTLYIVALLHDYHKKIANGYVPDFSPYHDPIIYRTTNNKLVELPEDIRTNAINKWNDMKKKEKNTSSKNYAMFLQAFVFIVLLSIIIYLVLMLRHQ